MAAVPQDLLDRVRTLERRVRELAGRTQMRPALTEIEGGDIAIGEGGRILVKAPTGAAVFESGQTPGGDWGVRLARQDGSAALTVGYDASPTQQMVQLWSRDTAAPDRLLVMDDARADRFLGRPWIPLQLHPTARQTTTQTALDVAWTGAGPAVNAVAELVLSTRAGTGGAQVKVTMQPQGGALVVLDDYDTPADTWTDRTITAPMHGIEYMQPVTWTIQHRAKTAGQTTETRVYRATGRQTLTADETPTVPVRVP
ncbi:hypothetical protein ACFQ7B_00415 [Streptomyces erythrochromogenes]|uniref:hypothetical protein n=1 Tax=Streptomyces erythrochromogenes TaxID=285574 RepID=UPI003680F841